MAQENPTYLQIGHMYKILKIFFWKNPQPPIPWKKYRKYKMICIPWKEFCISSLSSDSWQLPDGSLSLPSDHEPSLGGSLQIIFFDALMEDDTWWNMTFNERLPLMDDDFW